MKNKKQIILISIIVIVVIILATLGFFIYKKSSKVDKVVEKDTQTGSESPVEEEKKSMAEKLEKYFEEIDLKGKISKKNYDNDYALLKDAILKRELALCDNLLEYPKDDCLYDIASFTTYSKFCEKIGEEDLKDKCFSQIAKKNSTAIIESKKKTPYGLDMSIIKKAIAEINPAYCDHLLEFSKDDCYFEIATAMNVPKLCDDINSIDVKTKCKEMFIEKDAVAKKDANKCQEITNEELGKQCLFEVFKSNKDKEKCLKYDDEVKDKCLDVTNRGLAYESGNKKTCELIEDKALQAECLSLVQNKPKDSDGDGLTDSFERSLGTNPFKKDTDGDGYDDGVEISGGYNPLSK